MAAHETHVTNKSAQPYDQRFSEVDAGFKTDEGMVKAFDEYECEVCCRKTEWVHSKLAVYLCSRDCVTLYQQQQGLGS